MQQNKKHEEIWEFCFSLFQLDTETPIHSRLSYDHQFFFCYPRLSKFLLSVWKHAMDKGFISDKQAECIRQSVKRDVDDIISCFGSNLSFPAFVSRVAFGIEEGKKYSHKFFDNNGHVCNPENNDRLNKLEVV